MPHPSRGRTSLLMALASWPAPNGTPPTPGSAAPPGPPTPPGRRSTSPAARRPESRGEGDHPMRHRGERPACHVHPVTPDQDGTGGDAPAPDNAALQGRPQPQRGPNRIICASHTRTADHLTPANNRYAHLLWEVMCRAVSFKVRELICQCIALAVDPGGTFAIASMQPVSRWR